jgi:hypothetical protein
MTQQAAVAKMRMEQIEGLRTHRTGCTRRGQGAGPTSRWEEVYGPMKKSGGRAEGISGRMTVGWDHPDWLGAGGTSIAPTILLIRERNAL